MKVCFHASAEAFRDRVWSCLMESEVENNHFLGMITKLLTGRAQGPALMVSVEEEGEIRGVCVKMPLRGLVVSRLPEGFGPVLASSVRERLTELSGVMGPPEEAKSFAATWATHNGLGMHRHMRMRNYQLVKVTPPPPVSGCMEQATVKDAERLEDWNAAMVEESRLDVVDARALARQSIERGESFVWRDGEIVAVAVAEPRTPNGACIGMVYTPHEFRRRGYATALVAALSERVLASGIRFCFLYTDLDNPTSNGIYTRIGYRPVCDLVDYVFD